MSFSSSVGFLTKSTDYSVGLHEELPLETPFAGLTSVTPNTRDDIFTKSSLKSLVTRAHFNKKDYIFCIIEDATAKGSFADGKSFYLYFSSLERPFQNPLNRTPIMDVRFYVIKAEEKIEELRDKYISQFCTLSQFNQDPKYRIALQN